LLHISPTNKIDRVSLQLRQFGMVQAESLFPSLRQLIKDAPTPAAAVGDLTDFIKPLGCSSVDCVMSDRVLQRWGKSPIRHVYYHAGFPKDWDQRWPRYSMVDPLIPATSISLWPVNIHRLKGSTGGSALQREFWNYLGLQALLTAPPFPFIFRAALLPASRFTNRRATSIWIITIATIASS
jgi:hypothetical protein